MFLRTEHERLKIIVLVQSVQEIRGLWAQIQYKKPTQENTTIYGTISEAIMRAIIE